MHMTKPITKRLWSRKGGAAGTPSQNYCTLASSHLAPLPTPCSPLLPLPSLSPCPPPPSLLLPSCLSVSAPSCMSCPPLFSLRLSLSLSLSLVRALPLSALPRLPLSHTLCACCLLLRLLPLLLIGSQKRTKKNKQVHQAGSTNQRSYSTFIPPTTTTTHTHTHKQFCVSPTAPTALLSQGTPPLLCPRRRGAP